MLGQVAFIRAEAKRAEIGERSDWRGALDARGLAEKVQQLGVVLQAGGSVLGSVGLDEVISADDIKVDPQARAGNNVSIRG